MPADEQHAAGQVGFEPAGQPTPQQAEAIATLGYMYGYPLVLMDASRRYMTAVSERADLKAPLNQLCHLGRFPDHSSRGVVSPNVDTLYSTAWLDLGAEPLVLAVPEMGDRYYVMQMLDAWTNVFASPGTRTTGGGAGAFALVGPHWRGELPESVREIQSPTNLVWLIGRTYTAGPSDYEAVHALQARYDLRPLSAWTRPYEPPRDVRVDAGADARTPPVVWVAQMDTSRFFSRLARLMTDNPPAPDDEPLVERLRWIGVQAGAPFDLGQLPPRMADAVARGVSAARGRIAAGTRRPATRAGNGWRVALDLGRYGTSYQHRAETALVALGANVPEDAVYPMTNVDAEGRRLTGRSRYVIHFDQPALPPVRAFWSLTMYDERHFLVASPIGRHALGSRDDLRRNADGSLDIFIQHDEPEAAKAANWLPAPRGELNLIMRLYWPERDVLEGRWTPPPVVRLADER